MPRCRRYSRRIRVQRGGSEALIEAAEAGDVARVEELLATPGINANFQDDEGFAALHKACLKGHLAVVEALLAVPGINVNIETERGSTPLNAAAFGGHAAIVQRLLQVPGIDVNKEGGRHSISPLMTAARGQHVEVVRILLEDPRTDVNASDGGGRTSLYAAASNGNLEILNLLLQRPDIDVESRALIEQETILNMAARRGRMPILEALLADERLEKVDEKTLADAQAGKFNEDINARIIEFAGNAYAWLNALPATNLNVPYNATNRISFGPIQDGNNLYNFHNEATYGRYYTKDSFTHLNKKNPISQQPIARANVSRRTASVKRNIPAGSTNALTGEAIYDGDDMADFLDEADAGKFYKRTTVERNILPAAEDPNMDVRYYKARVPAVIHRGGSRRRGGRGGRGSKTRRHRR